MIKDLVILGFGFEIVGIFILVMVNTSRMWHGRYENIPFWKKRYWWMGRRPIYKNTKTLKWKIKLSRKVTIFGRISPKHKLNWLGFLFILAGIIFQILGMN